LKKFPPVFCQGSARRKKEGEGKKKKGLKKRMGGTHLVETMSRRHKKKKTAKKNKTEKSLTMHRSCYLGEESDKATTPIGTRNGRKEMWRGNSVLSEAYRVSRKPNHKYHGRKNRKKLENRGKKGKKKKKKKSTEQ